MKKNITINLFGALYNIDEDAYELLYRYQEDMKRYFAGREGGDEIADDIEHRVAELMAELKETGVEAITIEHIEAIIRRIGSPEQLDGEEEKDDAVPHVGKPKKKLFRNLDDKKIAGVLSGVAAYFGMDTLALRILAIILVFLTNGVGLLIYLICWLIIPEAKTSEDKLRMRGEPVNMENLREEILNGAGKVENFVKSPKTESRARGCLSFVMDLFVGLFKVLLYVFLGSIAVMLVLGLLFVACCIGVALYASIDGLGSLFFHDVDAVVLQTAEQLSMFTYIGFFISAVGLLVLLAVPAYAIIYWMSRLWGHTAEMTSVKRNTLLGLWLGALVLAATFATLSSISVVKTYEKQFLINGFYVPRWEYRTLIQENWKVLNHDGCTGFVSIGEHYQNGGMRYLHSNNVDGRMQYQMEKSDSVRPGIYRLEAVGRCNGEGAFIYACLGDSVYKQMVPVCGHEQGSIWQEARQRIAAGGLSMTDSIRYQEICGRHDGKGYGWSRVAVDSIVVTKPGMLRYGISNVPAFTGKPWRGTWMSATDFILIPVNEAK